MALITWTASQFGTNVGFADEEHQILWLYVKYSG